MLTHVKDLQLTVPFGMLQVCVSQVEDQDKYVAMVVDWPFADDELFNDMQPMGKGADVDEAVDKLRAEFVEKYIPETGYHKNTDENVEIEIIGYGVHTRSDGFMFAYTWFHRKDGMVILTPDGVPCVFHGEAGSIVECQAQMTKELEALLEKGTPKEEEESAIVVVDTSEPEEEPDEDNTEVFLPDNDEETNKARQWVGVKQATVVSDDKIPVVFECFYRSDNYEIIEVIARSSFEYPGPLYDSEGIPVVHDGELQFEHTKYKFTLSFTPSEHPKLPKHYISDLIDFHEATWEMSAAQKAEKDFWDKIFKDLFYEKWKQVVVNNAMKVEQKNRQFRELVKKQALIKVVEAAKKGDKAAMQQLRDMQAMGQPAIQVVTEDAAAGIIDNANKANEHVRQNRTDRRREEMIAKKGRKSR